VSLYNCTSLAFAGTHNQIGRDLSFGTRNMMRYLSSRSRAATAAEIDNLFITDLHCPPILFS
jgi:hypothetical protein